MGNINLIFGCVCKLGKAPNGNVKNRESDDRPWDFLR